MRRFWFRYQLIWDANQQNFISKSVSVFMHMMMALVKSVGQAEVSTLLFSFPQLEWFKGACCSGTKGWSCCRGHPRLVRDSMHVVGIKDLLLRRCERVKVAKDHPRQALIGCCCCCCWIALTCKHHVKVCPWERKLGEHWVTCPPKTRELYVSTPQCDFLLERGCRAKNLVSSSSNVSFVELSCIFQHLNASTKSSFRKATFLPDYYNWFDRRTNLFTMCPLSTLWFPASFCLLTWKFLWTVNLRADSL